MTHLYSGNVFVYNFSDFQIPEAAGVGRTLRSHPYPSPSSRRDQIRREEPLLRLSAIVHGNLFSRSWVGAFRKLPESILYDLLTSDLGFACHNFPVIRCYDLCFFANPMKLWPCPCKVRAITTVVVAVAVANPCVAFPGWALTNLVFDHWRT